MQNRQHGKELNKFFTPNRSDDLCLFFYIYFSYMASSQSRMSSVFIKLVTVYLQLVHCFTSTPRSLTKYMKLINLANAIG